MDMTSSVISEVVEFKCLKKKITKYVPGRKRSNDTKDGGSRKPQVKRCRTKS